MDETNPVHVVLRGGGTLTEIDLTTGTRLRTSRACEPPRGLSLNGNGQAPRVATLRERFDPGCRVATPTDARHS